MVIYEPAVVKIGRLASKAERIIFLFFAYVRVSRACARKGEREIDEKTTNNKQNNNKQLQTF